MDDEQSDQKKAQAEAVKAEYAKHIRPLPNRDVLAMSNLDRLMNYPKRRNPLNPISEKSLEWLLNEVAKNSDKIPPKVVKELSDASGVGADEIQKRFETLNIR
jgi:hypothetical protein